jgi:hypothetical protein
MDDSGIEMFIFFQSHVKSPLMVRLNCWVEKQAGREQLSAGNLATGQ